MSGKTAIAKICAACTASALVAAISCGAERTDEGAAKGSGGKPVAAAPAGEPSTPAGAPAEAPGGLGLDGVATVVVESKPGAESPLHLVLGEAGRLAGSLSAEGSECAVVGTLDGGIVRGWLECPTAAAGTPPWRGTLLGEKEGSSYSGTFAISDDGAATVINGTWKAGKL
ncbi:MAG: hypothetical protein M0R80_20970 [Proteobacteria bacterium]|jgi:hypothetical protein|nr:hypothetical protein [Pseudomonadota bacterium]